MIQVGLLVKQVNVDQALQKAENKVKKSAEKMDKSLSNKTVKIKPFGDKVKEDLQKVKKGLQGVGIGGDKLSKIGDVFSSGGGGKLAIAIATLTALWKGLKSVYDGLTVSVEQFIKKQEIKVKETQQEIAKEQKKSEQENKSIDRLKELSTVENISNASKKQAISIISKLTKSYGDLGISINSVTGEIEGLDQAQLKLLEKQRQKQAKLLSGQLGDQEALTDKKTTKAFIQLNSIFGTANFQQMLYDQFGLQGNVGKFRSDFDKQSTEKQLQMLRYMRNEYATTESQVTLLQQAIQAKQKQLEIEQKIADVKNKDFKAEQQKKIISEANREIRAEQQKQDSVSSAMDNTKEKAYFDSLKTSVQQIAYIEKQITDEQTKQANLNKTIEQVKNRKRDNDGQKAKDQAVIARLETQILQSQQTKLNLNLQLEKLQQKSIAYYTTAKENLDRELYLEKLKLQGKNQQAEKQKIINDLKKQGLKIDDKQIDLIMSKKQQLAGLKIKNAFQSEAEKLLYTASSQVNAKQAEYEKRVSDYQKTYGVSLNDEQRDTIKSLVNLQSKLKKTATINLKGMDIQTNQLTRRGGFANGAVMAGKDGVNQQIRNNSARQINLLSEIKQLIKTTGTI